METQDQKDQKNQASQSQNPHQGSVEFHKHYHPRRGVGILLGILLIILVFCLGSVFGSHYRGVRNSFGFRSHGGMMGYFDGDGVRGMGPGMMWGYSGQVNRIFGTINGISGDKITITNNAGQQQTVVSQSTTVIVSATGNQISLADLKNGDKISVLGSVDQNNQVTASGINVQP